MTRAHSKERVHDRAQNETVKDNFISPGPTIF